MESMSSMYHRARPMTKAAALTFPGVLGRYIASGKQFLGNGNAKHTYLSSFFRDILSYEEELLKRLCHSCPR